MDTYSYTYHVQSIVLHIPAAVSTDRSERRLRSWLYNKVGTRIELQQATLTGFPVANGQLKVTMTLANTGYGRVVRERPATILPLSGSQIVAQYPLPLTTMDLTRLAPMPVAQTFQSTLTLPSTFPSGQTISVALLVPDPAPSLTSQPAYALPLSSVDANGAAIFNPSTGYNLLATFQSQ